MTDRPERVDALVLGAGAAGLFCAARLGARGLRTLVLDHAAKPAEKVRISGGGRCNFTNIGTSPANFLSDNPHFAKSALARYTPWDFIALLGEHGIGWHEKTLGQLFCDERSGAIIQMLLDELAKAGAELRLNTEIVSVERGAENFRVQTSHGTVETGRVIVATGGPSIPKMGATGFGYDLARRFGLNVIEPRPALVPFVFSEPEKSDFASISGVACDVTARAEGPDFKEAMLFTHRGLSGPAILQASSYWAPGGEVSVDLFAGRDGADVLRALKAEHPMKTLRSALEAVLPKRMCELLERRAMLPEGRLADAAHATLDETAARLSDWRLSPAGTEGWRTAEVAAGGVDTAGLSSKTMEAKAVPGLYFIGECVDVTGWLGGYNFQWAWASAHAAGTA